MPHTRLIDLSHTIEDGMITYKGLPAPIVCDYLSRADSRARYAAGTEFQIGRIEMVGNTGTYLDAPFHRFADGVDISQLELASLADLDCVIIRATDRAARSISEIKTDGDLRGKAVLFHTGWDAHWRTDEYFEGHPHLTSDLAETLVAKGVALVGIDSLNIDCIDDGTRPVHTILLGAGIPIVEHLCRLDGLPDRRARFSAVPVKVKGMGEFSCASFRTNLKLQPNIHGQLKRTRSPNSARMGAIRQSAPALLCGRGFDAALRETARR